MDGSIDDFINSYLRWIKIIKGIYEKVFNILLIALILTILWILFLIINPNSSEIQGIKLVKTEYDNHYAEIDKKIEKEFDKNPKSYMKKEKLI